MRKYRTSAATEARVDYGTELVAGLQLFPETQDLAPAFEQLNTELDAAYQTRRSKRPALMKARVGLRMAAFQMDQVIRACSKAAEIADGARRGPVFETLFPENLGPVIAPAGARQIPPSEKLVGRMVKSKHPAVITFAQEWAPKLEAALAKLRSAADAHKAAFKNHGDAFQDELALREEHLLAVDKLMGQVRAAFPGDRAKQDLVFPSVASGGSASSGDEDDVEDDDEEPASGSEMP